MKDDRIREYVFPKRIMRTDGKVSNSENLLKERPLQIATAESELARFDGVSHIILDFGSEYCGGVRILTKRTVYEGKENAHISIRIRFGESVTESCAKLGEKNATNDHSVRDTTVLIGSHSDMEFCNTGFRFIRIDFPEGAAADIKAIVAVVYSRDLRRVGYFVCDDERLNRIYEVAARTCSLCMQSYLWDGIKRDRLVWMGDMHPEMLAVYALYGRDKCIEEALTFVTDRYRLPSFINDKPSYSLWFVIVLYDWYFRTGDRKILEKFYGYVKKLFDVIDGFIDENGETHFKGYFFDWPTHGAVNSNEGGSTDSKIGVLALLHIAIEKAEKIFSVLGKDSGKLLEIKSRLNGKKEEKPSFKQSAAFNALKDNVFGTEVADFLTAGGGKGLSVFTSYYILKVIAECNRKEKAFSILKEYYGAMIDKGATTFWEDFNLEWVKGTGRIDEFPKEGEEDIHGDRGDFCYKGFRHSLCHGWASGPVPFITEYLLGIKIKEAGCRKIEIEPFLPNGVNEAKGAFVTPYGLVETEHKRAGEKIVTTVRAPKEIEIIKK